jgi:glycosyltransferase involved in cell wall biosynthesis
VSTVTRQLTRSLLQTGHTVTVLTPDDGAPPYDDGRVVRLRFGSAARRSAAVHKALVLEGRLRGFTWPLYGSYLREVRRSLAGLGAQPDLVVVANDPELAVRLHRWGVGRQQVLWLHNRLEGREARRLRELPAAIRVVAVSESVRTWTAETYGLDAESILVIHNGIDASEFHPRDGFRTPRAPLRVVTHGRIDPNKGHLNAARAVASLRRQGQPVELTLVGGVQTFGLTDDEAHRHATEVERAVADAGGTWTGRVPAGEVAGILREHDVACVLSRSPEPFSLAALEAMASGCAVITTGTGGIAEVVGDSAVRVDPDATDQVANALATLIADPGLLSRRKVAAHRRSEQFSWGQAAQRVAAMADDARGVGP